MLQKLHAKFAFLFKREQFFFQLVNSYFFFKKSFPKKKKKKINKNSYFKLVTYIYIDITYLRRPIREESGSP